MSKNPYWESLTKSSFNKAIIFISGLFFSAILFLLMLRLMGTWGIYLALAASATLNIWLKKKHRENAFLNSLNNGLITFNLITVLGSVLILLIFFSTIQNLLN